MGAWGGGADKSTEVIAVEGECSERAVVGVMCHWVIFRHFCLFL